MGTSPNQLQISAILVRILRKRKDLKAEMIAWQTKTYRMAPQNWSSRLIFCEIRRKKAFVPTYCNLYAYAANNPVKYTDPDGREILFFVIRDTRSYNISTDRSSPKNTFLDVGYLYNTENKEYAFFSRMQTVANYPSTDAKNNPVPSCYDDTIGTGNFEFKVYTTTDVADGDAAVIINATTIDGRNVGSDGYTEKPKSDGRGLIHSNTNPSTGKDYNDPRSKQCFIFPGNDNKRFFDTLRNWGVKDGEIMKGLLLDANKNREDE